MVGSHVSPSHHESRSVTPERTHAYRRVIHTLTEIGPSKLLDGEQERIRHAADTLIFSRDLREDAAGRKALEDIERLCRALIDAGRCEQATAMRLADDVSQCGPTLLPGLNAA
jgi:hypothetical protein